jgi:hypothetical protein
MSVTKFDAVVSLVGNTVSVSCVDPDNTNTFFYQNGSAPSDADIKAKQAELQSLHDSQAYARSRKNEYDQLNQFELMYDDKVNSTDKWGEAILAIKNKHPKV